MALPNTNITPGAPPLLWSDVKDAFDKINENFDSLAATIGGGSGLTPVDFATLNTNVAPAYDNTYSLGALGTNRWKTVFVAEYHNTPGDTANGVYLGSAHIKGIGSHVDLPNNSTVNGQLIIDPDKTFFKSVQVDSGEQVVANSFVDTLNLLSGSGIAMTVDSGAESITIDNTGVLSIADGSGISHTTVSGVSTITNTGVRSLQSVTGLPTGRTEGAGISINGSTGDNLKITNTGVLSIEAGSAALTISTDAATGIVTITNAAPAGNTFRYVVVNGDTVNRIEADSVADILNFTEGQGITLTKNTTTDTVTITVNPVFDLKGSIFGDDSSKIVDAVENKVYAGNGFYGNLTGDVSGNLTGNVTGDVSGNAGSADVASTVDITDTNGLTTSYYLSFTENRTTGQILRGDVDLTYRTDTNTLTAVNFSGNLTGTVTGNIFTSLIDSADSSAITVTPKTIFSSDVDVENELRVRGSMMISVNQLKALAAASADFDAFKLAVAALTS